MSVIWLTLAALGAVILAFSFWISAPVAARLGIGTYEEAVVTERVDREASFPIRACRSNTRYAVEWDSGAGTFGVCTTRAEWVVGDPVRVAVAPWSREVSARSSDLGWNILGLGGGLLALVHGLRAGRHYHRLTRGGSGQELRGVVSAVGRTHVTVVPDPESSDPRRILLMPAAAELGVRVRDPVSIWSSRRGWSGRPRGPWVVESRGWVSVATHLWRRPPRN